MKKRSLLSLLALLILLALSVSAGAEELPAEIRNALDGNRMEILARAKKIVMEKFQLSESEAHRYIQKRAMDSGTGLVEMSEMVIMLYGSDQ